MGRGPQLLPPSPPVCNPSSRRPPPVSRVHGDGRHSKDPLASSDAHWSRSIGFHKPLIPLRHGWSMMPSGRRFCSRSPAEPHREKTARPQIPCTARFLRLNCGRYSFRAVRVRTTQTARILPEEPAESRFAEAKEACRQAGHPSRS